MNRNIPQLTPSTATAALALMLLGSLPIARMVITDGSFEAVFSFVTVIVLLLIAAVDYWPSRRRSQARRGRMAA
jgi:hypothetical protein